MGRGYGPTHSQSPFELFSGLTEIISVSYTPLINYENLINVIENQKESVLIFEPKIFYGDRQQSWMDLAENLEMKYLKGRVAPNIFIRKSTQPVVRIITHGSATKSVLEAIKSFDYSCEVLIISELYQDYNYLEFFTNSNTPLVIIEEKNSRYGAIAISISKELIHSKNNFSIVTNKSVINIPANSDWEKSMMIERDMVNDLILEAML